LKMRLHRHTQKLEDGPLLLTARLDDRPDPLAPSATFFTPRALRHPPMNGHESNRLLGQVVRGLHIRLGNETEVAVGVLLKTSGQIRGRVLSASVWYQWNFV